MTLRTRVGRLERRLPPPPEPAPRRRQDRRWRRVAGRFDDLLKAAWPLLDEAEQGRVADALWADCERERGPLDRWLEDLRAGRSRLPELDPPVMRDVLLAWLHPDVGQPMVCNGCGLEYPRLRRPGPGSPAAPVSVAPYQVLRLFDACPVCGASRYDTSWPGRTPGKDLPWKALDGWVGEQGPGEDRS
jgi:hypothetical protein